MFELNYFARLESSWDKLKAADLPIFIYGMGDGCNKILRKFDEYGIQPDGIFASDEFVRGHDFAGFRVQKYSEVEQQHSDFIVVPAFGTSLPDVMQRIDAIAREHTVIMPDTPVVGSVCFDKQEFLSMFSKAEKVYGMLADVQSKRVFENVLSYKITGDISYLKPVFSEPDEAYSLLALADNETYVDLGAFNGDTVMEFCRHTNGRYCKIYALEPDRKNFRKCVRNLMSYDNIELINAAASDKNELRSFDGNAGRQGKLSDTGRLTQCRSVDSVLGGDECTYIKYDVEGAEKQAIIGSHGTIEKYSPKICTALYHRAYDLIDLPLQLNEIMPEYKFYMRQYSYYPAWETNLFCVK